MYFSSPELAASSIFEGNGVSDSQIFWMETKGDYSVSIFSDKSQQPKKRVLCKRSTEGWYLISQTEPAGFLAYGDNEVQGLETFIWKVNPESKQVHLRFDKLELELPVKNGYVIYTFWDLSKEEETRWWKYPYPEFELWVDFERMWRYHDSAEEFLPPIAETICQKHYKDFRAQQSGFRGDHNPDYDFSYGIEEADRDSFLQLVLVLIEGVQNPQKDADYLTHIGSTALEGLFGDWLLTKLEDLEEIDSRLKLALSAVHLEYEPQELRERAKAILGPFQDLRQLSSDEYRKELSRLLFLTPAKQKRERKDKNIRIGKPRVPSFE